MLRERLERNEKEINMDQRTAQDKRYRRNISTNVAVRAK